MGVPPGYLASVTAMDQHAAEAYILGKLRHGLPAQRTYHSLAHTLDVYSTAVEIAATEQVEAEGVDLLRIAALYHDAGYLIQDHAHEEGSCVLVHEVLPNFGYSPEQVDAVCAMVMATRIPQHPADQLQRILCDADLDYLGRPDFFQVGHALFVELRHYGGLATEREWNELQASFLKQHTYFTERSQRLREPTKQLHLARVVQWLNEP
jgi:uncharacterized protein